MKKKTKRQLKVVAFILAVGFVLGLLVGLAVAAEPQFHIGDKVKVTSGFYRGCQDGTVVDLLEGSSDETNRFMVENLRCRGERMLQVVILPADVLELTP